MTNRTRIVRRRQLLSLCPRPPPSHNSALTQADLPLLQLLLRLSRISPAEGSTSNMATNPSRGGAGPSLHRQRSCSSQSSFEGPRLNTSSGSLIVVANRLPVSVTPDSSLEGGYRFAVSSGGLASALSGCKKRMDFTVRVPAEDLLCAVELTLSRASGLDGQVRSALVLSLGGTS